MPAMEALRLQAVQELGTLFRARCDALGGRKHFAHFEAWLWAARAEHERSSPANQGCTGVVPPIPLFAGATSAARTDLARKLVLAGLSEENARASCTALEDYCSALCHRLKDAEVQEVQASSWPPTSRSTVQLLDDVPPSLGSRAAGGHGKRKRGHSDHPPPPRAPEDPSGMETVRLVRLAHNDVEVAVTEHHLQKLRELFVATSCEAGRTDQPPPKAEKRDAGKALAKSAKVHERPKEGLRAGGDSQSTDASKEDQPFLRAAFSVLARLMALQGGHEGAGGMQGACPPPVFDVLRTDFGVTMECFASPVNTRFLRFCSAAVDVDAPFGSVGSFFRFRPRSGALVANPPFDPELITAMGLHMEKLLGVADQQGTVLIFIVVIPTWPERPCWQALNDSPHIAKGLRLPKSKHAYLDGGQHHGRRAIPLRLSNHDSSVFFLMSERAAAQMPVTFSKERRLREAFTGGLRILGALHK
jgi:phosphorylated CTD-interacting factor 1